MNGGFQTVSRHIAVGALVIAAWQTPALAQLPPSLKIVVPFAPGGASDIMTRVVGEQISRARNIPVIVENKPGAGSVLGTEYVARATPDGSTVSMVANSFLINSHVRKLNFAPLTDFAPLCYMVDSPNVIVTHATSPFRTMNDFIDAARQKPGALAIATNAPATAQHVAFELLKKAAKIDVALVPTPGTNPAMTMALGNHAPAVITSYGDFAPHAESGSARVLATTGARRVPPQPNAPTMRELGYDFDIAAWFGMVAPAKTPAPVTNALIEAFSSALKAPEVQAKLAPLQLYPVNMCGADFAAFLKKEDAVTGAIVRETGMKAE